MKISYNIALKIASYTELLIVISIFSEMVGAITSLYTKFGLVFIVITNLLAFISSLLPYPIILDDTSKMSKFNAKQIEKLKANNSMLFLAIVGLALFSFIFGIAYFVLGFILGIVFLITLLRELPEMGFKKRKKIDANNETITLEIKHVYLRTPKYLQIYSCFAFLAMFFSTPWIYANLRFGTVMISIGSAILLITSILFDRTKPKQKIFNSTKTKLHAIVNYLGILNVYLICIGTALILLGLSKAVTIMIIF